MFLYLGRCYATETNDIKQFFKNHLPKMDKNLVNIIFQFFNPKDFSDAVNHCLSEKQKKNFCKFQTRKYGNSPVQYFPYENGTHFLP